MKISDPVLKVLASCHVDGSKVFLPATVLERKLYLDVNKVLEELGGKWNRSAKGHVFPESPEDRLLATVNAGEITTSSEMGFFETPAGLADELVRDAKVQQNDRVLEPSAGHGALIDALFRSQLFPRVTALEADQGRVARLRKTYEPTIHVCATDFLHWVCDKDNVRDGFDAVVMNPPFAKQQDLDHVRAAFSTLVPGGRLVSVLAAGVMYRANEKTARFRDWVSSRNGVLTSLPDGTFKPATGVRTVKLVMQKE